MNRFSFVVMRELVALKQLGVENRTIGEVMRWRKVRKSYSSVSRALVRMQGLGFVSCMVTPYKNTTKKIWTVTKKGMELLDAQEWE